MKEIERQDISGWYVYKNLEIKDPKKEEDDTIDKMFLTLSVIATPKMVFYEEEDLKFVILKVEKFNTLNIMTNKKDLSEEEMKKIDLQLEVFNTPRKIATIIQEDRIPRVSTTLMSDMNALGINPITLTYNGDN